MTKLNKSLTNFQFYKDGTFCTVIKDSGFYLSYLHKDDIIRLDELELKRDSVYARCFRMNAVIGPFVTDSIGDERIRLSYKNETIIYD